MTWLATVSGTLLVLVALRDVFHTLWHPRGFGTLCRWIFECVWRMSKIFNRGARSTELAGPLGALVTVTTWGVMIVAGWTLIYLPHMPEGFFFGSPQQPATSPDLVTAAYLSLVAVGTLGFGDVVPATPALRLAAPLEALMGFILLTATISWILEIYPALGRRRGLARRLSMLAATGGVEAIGNGDPGVATRTLESLSEGVTSVELDVMQYGETYYFRESEPDLSLAATLPCVLDLVAAGERSADGAVRHAAALLDEATTNLAARLDRVYLKTHGSTREVLEAFAVDHQHRPLSCS